MIVIGLTIIIIGCEKLICIRFSQKLNAWAGMIIGDRILEPVFLNCNFDGTTYLTLLLEDLMPGLAALFSNPLDPHLLHERIWYQQDGAPPHYVEKNGSNLSKS
jgi:hypothetical protein